MVTQAGIFSYLTDTKFVDYKFSSHFMWCLKSFIPFSCREFFYNEIEMYVRKILSSYHPIKGINNTRDDESKQELYMALCRHFNNADDKIKVNTKL